MCKEVIRISKEANFAQLRSKLSCAQLTLEAQSVTICVSCPISFLISYDWVSDWIESAEGNLIMIPVEETYLNRLF